MPANLFMTIRSESSWTISNLYSYGFKEAFFGSGISKIILSPVDIFFDGSFTT